MAEQPSSELLQAQTEAVERRGRPTGPEPFETLNARSQETLEERYDGDAQLLAFYKKKLLKRGWAGKRDRTEREYQRRMRDG